MEQVQQSAGRTAYITKGCHTCPARELWKRAGAVLRVARLRLNLGDGDRWLVIIRLPPWIEFGMGVAALTHGFVLDERENQDEQIHRQCGGPARGH